MVSENVQAALKIADNVLTTGATLPLPNPTPTPTYRAPSASQKILFLEAKLNATEQKLDQVINLLQQRQQQQAQPTQSAHNPLTEMAAAWSMFNSMQQQAQAQVQANYDFTRRLAEDIAAGKSPAGEDDGINSVLKALPQLLPLLQQQPQQPAPQPQAQPTPIEQPKTETKEGEIPK